MSPSWRNELQVTLGSSGLGLLPEIAPGTRVAAIVSSHHARYALLPWSPNLGGEADWLAYARHRFASVYGPEALNWVIRISPAPRRSARLACALEPALLEGLRRAIGGAGARLVSVRPGLMEAFNAKRGAFRSEPGWLVAAEEGRLTLALIARGLWELVRVRNVGPAWRDELPALLRREELLAKRDATVERIVFA